MEPKAGAVVADDERWVECCAGRDTLAWRPQEQKAVVVMTEDERRLEADWNRERQRLEGEIESLAVKIEAEAKMRLGAHRLCGRDWTLSVLGVAWRGVAWRGVAWRGVAWHPDARLISAVPVAGVEEYKRKLTDEMHVVQLKLKIEHHSCTIMQGYQQKLDAEVGNFQRKSELAARDIAQLEEQKQQLLGEVQDLRIKIGGELEHITERLEADTRSNYTLEGYRRKLGDELFLVKRRLGLLA